MSVERNVVENVLDFAQALVQSRPRLVRARRPRSFSSPFVVSLSNHERTLN